MGAMSSCARRRWRFAQSSSFSVSIVPIDVACFDAKRRTSARIMPIEKAEDCASFCLLLARGKRVGVGGLAMLRLYQLRSWCRLSQSYRSRHNRSRRAEQQNCSRVTESLITLRLVGNILLSWDWYRLTQAQNIEPPLTIACKVVNLSHGA